jgi:hypothetical protein
MIHTNSEVSDVKSTPHRIGAAFIVVSLLGGCGVAPYGAQVYLGRVEQNYSEVVQSCGAGDQVACAIRPFVAKAVAQAQEDAWLPWK